MKMRKVKLDGNWYEYAVPGHWSDAVDHAAQAHAIHIANGKTEDEATELTSVSVGGLMSHAYGIKFNQSVNAAWDKYFKDNPNANVEDWANENVSVLAEQYVYTGRITQSEEDKVANVLDGMSEEAREAFLAKYIQ